MAKNKLFHIIGIINKTSVHKGSYDDCLNMFNLQDKVYRKTHKIISAEDYIKIINKKPTL
jgi:hypothetical protein